MTGFDEKDDETIKNLMFHFEKRPDRFVKISEFMPKYTPKQLSNRWRDHLEPNLCKEAFTEDEKRYIIERTPNYRKSNKICWKGLSSDMEKIFNRRHSNHKIKNYWNANQRRQKKKNSKLTVTFLLNDENEANGEKKSSASIKNDGRIPVTFLLNDENGEKESNASIYNDGRSLFK